MTSERRVSNYAILDRLGEGGMGEVFLGRDVMLERPVAIKSLRPELAARLDVVERFRTEAIALAKLNHVNIAGIYSFLREDDRYYMVMEFVDGESLDALLRRQGRLDWREALTIVRQALAGLEHAHRAGIVHRDVKPANIMLTREGAVKLTDFGIARILQSARLTREGHLVGTLEYMSPEQIQGHDVDARADLYSLGIVLYELLTGEVPFQAASEYAIMRAHLETSPAAPSRSVPGVPAHVDAVLLRAMAKAPEERYQGAAEFADALVAATTDVPSLAVRKAPPPTRLTDKTDAASIAPNATPAQHDASPEPSLPDPASAVRAAQAPAQASFDGESAPVASRAATGRGAIWAMVVAGAVAVGGGGALLAFGHEDARTPAAATPDGPDKTKTAASTDSDYSPGAAPREPDVAVRPPSNMQPQPSAWDLGRAPAIAPASRPSSRPPAPSPKPSANKPTAPAAAPSTAPSADSNVTVCHWNPFKGTVEKGGSGTDSFPCTYNPFSGKFSRLK